MKKIILLAALTFAANVSFAQWEDDLYSGTSSRTTKKEQTTAAQSAAYEQTIQENSNATSMTGGSELITTYEEALQRRISAMREASEMDDAYWGFMEQYQAILEQKYDKNLYNIVVVGKDMWVEPQYITALFNGTDPAEGVIAYNEEVLQNIVGNNYEVIANENANGGDTYNIYVIEDNDPDFYVGFGYSPWRYSSWYRPWRYSYYDPFWYDPFYNPWYPSYGYYPGWGYPGYPGYYPGYYPSYRPYRPYRNPRGTYYGNSRYNSPSHRYDSRPVGGGGRSNSISRPSSATRLKPTGSNTINGLRRPEAVNTRVPNGSVRDNHKNGTGVVGTMVNRGNTTNNSTHFKRPTPTTNNNNNNSYRRPTENMNTDRNNNNREFKRPTNTNNNRTYDRPTTNSRPSTPSFSRPTSVPSRPSGGSVGGGGRTGVGRRR